MKIEPSQVLLPAYAALEAALTAESYADAVEAVQADLEVLAPEVLRRVAAALAVESTRRLLPLAARDRALRELRRLRLEEMWAGS